MIETLKTLKDLEDDLNKQTMEDESREHYIDSEDLRLEAQKWEKIFKCFSGWCLSHDEGLEYLRESKNHSDLGCEVITLDNWREWFFNLKKEKKSGMK